MPRKGISDLEKATVIVACQKHIEDFLKPRFLSAIRPTKFNYQVDILGKWRGSSFSFLQRYRSGFPENLGEEFNAPFARLDWTSRDRFDLMWHRHTGKWFRLHHGLSLEVAMATLKTDGVLYPV